jgi:amino acid adenylation domain-containing protein
MVDFHHIVVDGVSSSILLKEFMELYKGENLVETVLQYRDYSEWQNSLEEKGIIKEQEEYWVNRLDGELPVLNIQTDYERPRVKSYEGGRLNFVIGKELTEKLNKVAKDTGVTLYTVLLAAYNVMLSKYTGQEDIIVGTAHAGRSQAELDNVVGMFVNTVALRNCPKGSKSFREFLEEVKTNTLRDFENTDYQFESLIRKLDIKRDSSRNPLFDVMFVLENIDFDSRGYNERIKLIESEFNISKFDLTLTAVETGSGISFSLEYCSKLFNENTIEMMSEHFINILNYVATKTNVKLCEIDIVSEYEKNKLLEEFNDTKTSYPKDKTIKELFEEQVEKTPNNIAVVYEDKQLTYKELNERANSLARVLRDKGVKEETIIGIMVERSLEMIVGMMGILKAGGAYLPIDPEYPEDRIKYMLEDSNALILLTQNKLVENIDYNGKIIDLEDERLYEKEKSNLYKMSEPNNLAYVIYTSGTTGKPKGVMLNHLGISNLKVMFQNDMNIDERDKIIQFASFSFDASVWETTMALLNGAQLNILSKEIINNHIKFVDYLNNNGITVATLPPVYLNNIDSNEIKTLRLLITAGSAIKKEMLNKWSSKVKYINAYGPTETTICSTKWHYSENVKELDAVPIGKPINNLKVYIVNKNLELLPIGVAGELCVGGEGLARGYLNREELTKEKFVNNPFSPGTKMYRTGDLAKWLPDGSIEFLGRIDDQVKIRGYRIELAEIENVINGYEKVKECVAVSKNNKLGEKDLVLYYVAEDKGEKIKTSELVAYLSTILPHYMLPQMFIQIDKIPITINGKVDTKVLLELENDSVRVEGEYNEATTELEKAIRNIWFSLLDKNEIDIHDNFFEVGGDSIKLATMINEIQKIYPNKIEITDIFAYPTIYSLAKLIENSDSADEVAATTIKQDIEPIEVPIEYIIDKNEYNEGSMLKFKFENEAYDEMNNICKNNNFEMGHFLLAGYVFLLSEVCEQQIITVQMVIDENNIGNQLKFDISGIDNFSDIVTLVKDNIKNLDNSNKYNIDSYSMECKKLNGNFIIPLFSKRKNIKYDYFALYDLIFKMDEGINGIEIICEYNDRKLRKVKMQELFYNYVNLIQGVINSYLMKSQEDELNYE